MENSKIAESNYVSVQKIINCPYVDKCRDANTYLCDFCKHNDNVSYYEPRDPYTVVINPFVVYPYPSPWETTTTWYFDNY